MKDAAKGTSGGASGGAAKGASGGAAETHERKPRFILARFERWALPRMATALPGWVLPDHLTLLGVVAATFIAVCYALSNRSDVWLIAASGALVVHWFGDSLDGTLARVRRIERPRYGYYLDHLTDAYSTSAIGIGLGLSPYMLLSVGLAIVIAYLILSINVYLETQTLGEFKIGYAWFGPTEARVVLIGLNTLALFRKLPRQADRLKANSRIDVGLGRNVSGGTRPRLSWGRSRL